MPDRHTEAQQAVDCVHLASQTPSAGADVHRREGKGLGQCGQKQDKWQCHFWLIFCGRSLRMTAFSKITVFGKNHGFHVFCDLLLSHCHTQLCRYVLHCIAVHKEHFAYQLVWLSHCLCDYMFVCLSVFSQVFVSSVFFTLASIF